LFPFAPHHHLIVTFLSAPLKAHSINNKNAGRGARMEKTMSLKTPACDQPETALATVSSSNASAIAAPDLTYAQRVEEYLEWANERSAELRAELAKPDVAAFGNI